MPTDQEKSAFARRLRLALNRSPDSVKGATELALRFNLRHRVGSPVSPQTTHKWLSGRSIPTADKIKTLATWLDVNEHWLHDGPAPSRILPKNTKDNKNQNASSPPSTETLSLATKIQALSSHQRYLVEELVLQLYGNDLPE
jgi:transcriptional regulator with XRE-family HTH domain